jgi:hypothetical protein
LDIIFPRLLHHHETPIDGYFVFKPIPALNPTTADLELEHNQLFNWLEQLHSLEQ